MKIQIHHNAIELTPQNIKNIVPNFGLRGRRFDVQIEGEKWIKNICLNELISSVKNRAKQSDNDLAELRKFLKTFHILKNKGYQGPRSLIKKENFLIELITKIKHFFAEIKREKMLKELDQIVQEAGHITGVSFLEMDTLKDEEIDELEEFGESQNPSIDPVHFESLSETAQLEILREADSKSFLAFYQTSEIAKDLIETQLPKELKKAQLEHQAFFECEKYLKNFIYQSPDEGFLYYSDLEYSKKLIKRFIPSYAKEIAKALNHLLIRTKDVSLLYSQMRFEMLMHIAEMVSFSHPKATIEILKKAVDIRLSDTQKIRPNKHNEIMQFMKMIAAIDPTSAIEYCELLRSHMSTLQDNSNEILDCLEVLALMAPESLKEYENLLQYNNKDSSFVRSRKYHLVRHIAQKATTTNLEQIFNVLFPTGNEFLENPWLSAFMHGALTRGNEDIIPFIQTIIENPQSLPKKDKNSILEQAVRIYICFGKLEEAANIINFISNPVYKKATLSSLAKAYVPINPNQSLELLKRIRQEDDVREQIVKIYTLIDIERAQNVCSQIRNPYHKIKALFAIAEVLKKTNIQAANQMWEEIFILNSQDSYSRCHTYSNLFKIAQQMAETDPIRAKTFLENKLRPLTRRSLFEMVIQKRTVESRNENSRVVLFNELIDTYFRIDPVETENWIKDSHLQIRSGYQFVALMSLKDSIV